MHALEVDGIWVITRLYNVFVRMNIKYPDPLLVRPKILYNKI